MGLDRLIRGCVGHAVRQVCERYLANWKELLRYYGFR